MLPDQPLGPAHQLWAKPVVFCQFDLGFEPELGLAPCTLSVYVQPPLFSREETEPEATRSEDSGNHAPSLA